MQTQYQFAIDALMGQSREDAADFGLEMHAISSSCKPVAGWLVRDGIQECREACAGHGYLKGVYVSLRGCREIFWKLKLNRIKQFEGSFLKENLYYILRQNLLYILIVLINYK